MTLKTVRSGSTVIDFEASPYLIIKFRPGDPEQRKEDMATVFAHGRKILYARHENAIMTLEMLIYGTSMTTVDNAVQDLTKLVDDVLARVMHVTSPKTYLHWTPESGTEWRTEIIRARFITDDVDRRAEDDNRVFTLTASYRYYRRVFLEIERPPFWEDPTLTEIGLSNGNGTNQTGGIIVWTHNDAGTGHDNFTTIASVIGGTERTPLVLSFQHDISLSGRVGDLYVSRNARNDPTSADSVLNYEAENASLYNGGSTQSSALRSNGQYVQWTGTPSAYSVLAGWTLSSASLTKYGGRWFHVLAQIMDSKSDTYLGAKLQLSGTTLSETPMKLVEADGMVDLGAIRIPPYVLPDTMYSLTLELWGYTVGAAMNLEVDFVHLMPSEQEDGFIHFSPQGYNLPEGWTLKYDGYEETLSVFGSTGSISNYQPVGAPMYVTPGVTGQRLYWLWDTWTGDADATWFGVARAWYRKRRTSV